MASYLSIYIKPKGVDKKVLLFNYSRSSGIYQFFHDNNLSIYAYSGNLMPQSEQERFAELNLAGFDSALSALSDEIAKDNKRLALMKELESKSDVDDILSFQDYVQEEEELRHHLEIIRNLIPNKYTCNDIEAFYTNYN